MDRLDRAIALTLAALVACLGFLPIANWIPGGHAAPWYGLVATDLLTGLSIAAGGGLVLGIFSRRVWPLWRDGRLEPLHRSAQVHWLGWTAAIAAVAVVLYTWIAREVLAGRPLLIDEIIQVFQARLLASGHLWIPAAPHQVFFSSLHLVEQEGRVYGQFPMGGPAMLALGSLAGAEWLVNPVFAGLSVVAFGALLLRIEPRSGIRLGALLILALSPFTAFMSGSHMNHVTALFWIILGMLGLVRAASNEAGRFQQGLLAGVGFGIAATIRPVDAMAFAAPAGLWLLLRAIKHRRVAALLGSGLGLAIPILLLCWANLETTGAPFRFGYTVLWGKAHDLGFHASPWGPVHTPERGLELINLYFLRLQTYFLETAAPALIPMTVGLALTRRFRAFDRYLLSASLLLIGLYAAYWHDGFYLGPRFMYPLLPVLALWTARFLPALREAFGSGLLLRSAISVSLKYVDRELLHLVADARYITHSQLFQLARLKALEFERAIFNWRVRRLVNSGLLRKQVVPYLGTDALYSITRGGIQALEEMGISYLGGYVEREKDPNELQIPHVLELNRIRLALERSKALVFWIPESFIRVVNLSPTACYAKAYDAVACVTLGDGVSTEFAIEYERTLKSEQKYEKILEAIASEKRLHTILYLAPSYEIIATLRWYFQRTRHEILLAMVDDFKKDVLDTRVDLANSYRRMTLREALARSASSVLG